MPSRAPATATPASSATTRSSPPAPTPARSLHVRLRKGSANTQRGALRFVDELIARVRRAGAAGQKLLRADSGFWNKKVFARLREHGCAYSIGVTLHKIVTAQIALIAEDAWQPVADYPDSGEAQIAETTLGGRAADRAARTRTARTRRPSCCPTGATSRSSPTAPNPSTLVEAEHRQHAVVELVIRDLKDQALAHFPSGHYNANSAWTVIACLAHNLGRWTPLLGLPTTTVRAAAHAPPPPARAPRPPDPHRAPLDASPPRPLALGTATSPTRSPASARSHTPPEAPTKTTTPAPRHPATLPAARRPAAPPLPASPHHARTRHIGVQPPPTTSTGPTRQFPTRATPHAKTNGGSRLRGRRVVGPVAYRGETAGRRASLLSLRLSRPF